MKSTAAMKRNAKKNPPAKEPDARVRPIVEAIDAAAEIFRKENSLLEAGNVSGVEQFLEKKREAEREVKRAGAKATSDGFSLVPGTPEAKLVEASLERLKSEVDKNAAYLQGAFSALNRISDLVRRAVSEKDSEGMYSRRASRVLPTNKALLGFGTSI